MSARSYYPPLGVRLPRSEREGVIAYARHRNVSISSVLKTALRYYFSTVHGTVNGKPPQIVSEREEQATLASSKQTAEYRLQRIERRMSVSTGFTD